MKTARTRKNFEDAYLWLKSFRVPRNATFDLDVWGMHEGDHEPSETNHCGTTACAIGWLAVARKYKGQPKHRWEGNETDGYELLVGYKKWEDYLGLSYEEFEYLFLPDGYTDTPRKADVVRRMKRVLDGKGIEE
jgi:hypothetical protein